MNVLFFSTLAFAVLLAGCQSGPILSIRSNVPARIEMGGTTVCDSTPCKAPGYHYRDGYNLGCVRGAESKLEAFSLDPAGLRQSKEVVGGCGEVVDVYFDMNAGGVVNTTSTESRDPSERMKKLNELKEKNLISEDEYKKRRKEIIDSI